MWRDTFCCCRGPTKSGVGAGSWFLSPSQCPRLRRESPSHWPLVSAGLLLHSCCSRCELESVAAHFRNNAAVLTAVQWYFTLAYWRKPRKNVHIDKLKRKLLHFILTLKISYLLLFEASQQSQHCACEVSLVTRVTVSRVTDRRPCPLHSTELHCTVYCTVLYSTVTPSPQSVMSSPSSSPRLSLS